MFPDGSLAVSAGDEVKSISVLLWRQASVSGIVLDRVGEALVGQEVWAFERVSVAGRPHLRRAVGGITNDKGEFRLSGLTPGDFVVGVPLKRTLLPTAGANSRVSAQEMTVRTRPGEVGGGGAIDDRVYAPIFFPQTADPSAAQIIGLGSGENRSGIDFHLDEVTGFTIRGRVVDASDQAVALAAIHLLVSPGGNLTSSEQFEVVGSISDSSGDFILPKIPPGTYRLTASQWPAPTLRPGADPALADQLPTMALEMAMLQALIGAKTPEKGVRRTRQQVNAPSSWGSEDVVVRNEDVAIRVHLKRAARISGRVTFEGAGVRPAEAEVGKLSIAVEPADGDGLGYILPAAVARDGTFHVPDLRPGRYWLRVDGQIAGWTLRSLAFSEGDHSQFPLELAAGDSTELAVVLSSTPSAILRGNVRSTDARPATSGVVFVFPADPHAWQDVRLGTGRFAMASLTSSATYTIQNLRSGDYIAAAVSDDVAQRWQRSGFLSELAASGERFSLRDGQQASRDLRLIAASRKLGGFSVSCRANRPRASQQT